MIPLESHTPLIETLLSAAADLKADAEIMISGGKSVSVRVFEGRTEQFTHTTGVALGVRVVKDGVEGIAYTERLDEKAALETLREAVDNASVCAPEYPAFIVTPPPLPERSYFYNPALETVTVDDLTQFALRMESAARNGDAKIINVPYAIASLSDAAMRIASTRGIDRIDYGNSVGSYVGVLAEENGERRSGGESDSGRDFTLFNPESLAATAVAEAVSLLGGIAVPVSGNVPAVIRHEAFAELLGSFTGLFSAKQVQEGKSLLAGRLESRVAAPIFSLTDDPFIVDGEHSQCFDSEGVPGKPLELVKRGVLHSYLHNSQTAARAGCDSTGHASRSPKSSLGIAPTNWVVDCGDAIRFDVAMAQEKELILIHGFQGLHAGVNAISGDFSLMAEGFLFRGGKRVGSLKPFTVSGNILTLLDAIRFGICDRRRTASGIFTPSVFVNSVGISG